MKKIIVLVICLLMLVLWISQQNKNEEGFINNVKSLENGAEVMLKEVAPFEWDMAYSFYPYTSKEEIQETIGFKANISETVSEGMPHLIFVKDKKVVCEIIGYPSNLGINIDYFSNGINVNDNIVFKAEKNTDFVCLSEKTTDLTEDEIWNMINEKEWRTLEGSWSLGYGIYFYTENDTKYALSMTYGSGLPVMSTYQSEAKVHNNKIYMDIPNHLLNGNMSTKEEVTGITLTYKDYGLYFGNTRLEYHPGFSHYDEWVKYN
ncbi:MAG: hypothetical protein MJA31_03795 [Clostridia bacterium]|nr:hypothetical protein [Clostridia bacterium]